MAESTQKTDDVRCKIAPPKKFMKEEHRLALTKLGFTKEDQKGEDFYREVWYSPTGWTEKRIPGSSLWHYEYSDDKGVPMLHTYEKLDMWDPYWSMNVAIKSTSS